jgi:hypothetical protein
MHIVCIFAMTVAGPKRAGVINGSVYRKNRIILSRERLTIPHSSCFVLANSLIANRWRIAHRPNVSNSVEPTVRIRRRKKRIGRMANRLKRSIRHIGAINVVESKVDMRFRVTSFWNDRTRDVNDQLVPLLKERRILQIQGRRKAQLKKRVQLDIPQVAILNFSALDILNFPAEVTLLNEKGKRLLRWTCEFLATFQQGLQQCTLQQGLQPGLQQGIDAKLFPYDEFDLRVDLGISVYKQVGREWDETDGDVLGLATWNDNERKATNPHGAVENNVIIPGFLHKPLVISSEKDNSGKMIGGKVMRYRIRVRRQHAYFNQNILLPLVALHICAIMALVLPIEDFAGRASVLLTVAFLEIGLRLSLDSRLPEVADSALIQDHSIICITALDGGKWSTLFYLGTDPRRM